MTTTTTTTTYLTLPWGEYHRLNPHVTPRILGTLADARDAREDASDEILCVRSALDASRGADAFRHLAWAAWTPNQDAELRDSNGHRMLVAERIIERLRWRAAEAVVASGRVLHPTSTLPAPRPRVQTRDGTVWETVWEGLDRRYAAGLQSLLDRPDVGLRVRAVVSRLGKGGGFVVVCRIGDDLRDLPGVTDGLPGLRPAEAELTFVLRRASSGSGRLMLCPACRRDPAGGPPFRRPYGRLTVLGRSRPGEESRWLLREEDAERLVRRRVLPELAWKALGWWELSGPQPGGPPYSDDAI